jgi:alkanesulfonate monooxygenase SsuD/methylene tetrahydromethanopterin reductase-like flavin-dependent oxidoreductase (luciferase family)
MLALRERSGKAIPQGTLEERRRGMLKGFGNFRLTGDPDFIAGEFAKLSAVGVDGIAMMFFNQKLEVPYFLQEVEPRLKRLKLRE